MDLTDLEKELLGPGNGAAEKNVRSILKGAKRRARGALPKNNVYKDIVFRDEVMDALRKHSRSRARGYLGGPPEAVLKALQNADVVLLDDLEDTWSRYADPNALHDSDLDSLMTWEGEEDDLCQ